MNLRQQIVQDRIEKTAATLGVVEDMAFLRFAHSVIIGQSIHAFDPSDLTDGAQEKQIDAMTIEPGNDEVNLYIIQIKNSSSFSSNQLILMRNGLDWVFNKPRADLNTLSNISLKDKIIEYRSVQSGSGPSNIHVMVAFVANGLTAELSDEFRQEAKSIRDQYDNGTFAGFSLGVWTLTSS
jgi:hypothetical protein